MRKGLLSFSLLAALLVGSSLWAQTGASLTGQVTDTTGAAIPGAKVTVTNEGNRGERIVATSDAGVYNVPALTPGVYTIVVEVKGFRTAQSKGVELQVQQAARMDFSMEVGQVTQVVEVQGGAIQINTENATVGSVIENQRIVDLPLNGRNFLQLTALDANVSFGMGNEVGAGSNRVGGDRVREMISVAGGRTEFNYYTLDGITNTDVSFNTYTFLPSIDAIQEFKIQTGIFPAEFGRGTATINISTKPGTNNLHGALFEFVRNSSTDAQQYCFNFATAICPPGNILHQNQFGATVGGPVYIPRVFDGRNKLFFLFNYEGYRLSQAVNTSGSVMTAAQRNGDFTGFPTLYDPKTRVVNAAGNQVLAATPFSAKCGGLNMVPNGTNCGGIPSRIDPIAVKLLAFEPLPTAAGSGTNLFTSFPNSQVNDQYTIRMDFNQNSNSTWFGRGSWGGEVGTLINGPIKENNNHIASHPVQIELSNIRTFSPTLVNDARFGYNRLINGVLNYNSFTGINFVGELGGIPGVATPYPAIYGVPSVSIGGLSGWGDDAGIPSLIWNNTYQVADTLSKVHGKHSFRMGADVRRDQFNSAANSFIRGAFSWNGQYTQNPSLASSSCSGSCLGGVPAADYLLGIQSLFDSALALAQTEHRGTSQAYFVDDTYKVRRNVTLSIGLRYEYVAPYTEKHDNVANILWPAPNQKSSTGLQGNPGPAPLSHPVFIRPGTGDFYANTPALFTFGGGILTARTNDPLGQALYRYWKTNFAPRLGIAYSPTPNWVVRLGAGMFFMQDQHNIDFDPGRNLAARRQLPANQTIPNLTLADPLGGGASINVLQPFVLAAAPNMKTPYLEQYLIDVQRQITQSTMITVGYMGNMGHQIQGLMDHNNPPVPGPGSLSNVPGSLRPFPEFGVIQTNSPWVNSAYNGLSVRLNKKTSHGLSLNVAYTWSRAIDTDSAIRDHNGDTQFPQDPYHPGLDRGLSAVHVAHRLVTSYLYDLPVGKGRPFMNQGGVANAVLGGWQIGGIVTMQSGFASNTNSGADPANIGEAGYERPDYTGLPVKPSHQTINNWVNYNAFAIPKPYTYGNVGRNTVLGPWLGAADLNLQKRFAIHEGPYFELRFEGFNATNHPNFSIPNINLSNKATFGTITGTNTNMRQLQLGLKFVW